MFRMAEIGSLSPYVRLGLIAIVCGCQQSGTQVSDQSPSVTAPARSAELSGAAPQPSTEAGKKSIAMTDIPAEAISEDGLVVLGTAANETPVSDASGNQNRAADVILDLPAIPVDAQFGNPTLAEAATDVVKQRDPARTTAELTAAASTTDRDKTQSAASASLPSAEKTPLPPLPQAAGIGNLATDAELHQKIAEDWPKPQAVLFLTGQQHGYIEPCGCTGLDRQKGGLIRRDALVNQLRDRGWDVVPLDVGNQVRRGGRQPVMKFQTTAKAFELMQYKAVTLGNDDLMLSSSDLLQIAGTDNENRPREFISANTSVFDPSFWPQTQIVEVGGRKIGITAYLDPELAANLPANDVTVEKPEPALSAIVKDLKSKGCDYLVLLAHASQAGSEKMATKVPGFDLVVTAGGSGEPRNVLDPIPGSQSLIAQVGTKGMYACIVGLFDDASEPVRYQRIALSSQFKDSPRMLDLFQQYQERLKATGFEGLGLSPKPHPSGREFVGSESCGDCHTTAFAIWKDSPHFHATDSIVTPPNDRGAIPRHFDPECVSCHVTGWDPEKYTPYATGYWSLDQTPNLLGSGCENCHGPGSQHVKAENGDIDADDALLAQLREQMRLPLEHAPEKCIKCHDLDNSPDFHVGGGDAAASAAVFNSFWERVKHYGKD